MIELLIFCIKFAFAVMVLAASLHTLVQKVLTTYFSSKILIIGLEKDALNNGEERREKKNE